MRKNLKRVIALTTVTALAAGLAGCGNSSDKAAEADTSSDSEVRQIKVAVAGGFYPITYADDNGEAQGYDVEVFKAVDELLPQYEFTYEITDKETMNVGVQSGSYQIGINSLFKTDERTETYYIPENNAGYTAVGLIHRQEDDYNTFEDVYDAQAKAYPVNAAGGIRYVYERWNEENPDKQFDYELTTEFNYADLFASIQAGDYDFTPDLIPVFELQQPETVEGLVISDPVDVIPTYPIITKSETQLGDDINEALGQLKENGTLSKISTDTFGYDVFELAND